MTDNSDEALEKMAQGIVDRSYNYRGSDQFHVLLMDILGALKQLRDERLAAVWPSEGAMKKAAAESEWGGKYTTELAFFHGALWLRYNSAKLIKLPEPLSDEDPSHCMIAHEGKALSQTGLKKDCPRCQMLYKNEPHMLTQTKKSGLSFKELEKWLRQNMFGFYIGCRVDEHSPQIKEFYNALLYYLEKDFGFVAEERAEQALLGKKGCENSKTLEILLKHWDEVEGDWVEGKEWPEGCFTVKAPFNIEAFCKEMDELIETLMFEARGEL